MKVHVAVNEVTDHGIHSERSLEIEDRANNPPARNNEPEHYLRLRDLSSKLNPILRLMKITGTFHGDISMNRDQQMSPSSFCHRLYCIGLMLIQWILVLQTVISIFYEGLSRMRHFYLLLIYSNWYLQGAVVTSISFVVLMERKKLPSRFTGFITNLLGTATDFNGIKARSVNRLTFVVCVFTILNMTWSILLDIYGNVSPAKFRPWKGSFPYRVLHILLGAVVCCSWTTPFMLFCITSAILEGMFESLNKKALSECPTPFSVRSLRQHHLKLCETVALADKVFSPFLLATFVLDIPLLCINFHQLVKAPSSEVIFILTDTYWCLGVTAKLAIVLKYGVEVSEKVKQCAT